MSLTIPSGGLAIKDPADSRSFVFDWDAENLGPTAIIATSTFALTFVRGTSTPALTKDSEAKLTAVEASNALQRTVTIDDRATRLRLIGGALGSEWDVANTIQTNETPPQIKERSFRVTIENQ